MKEYILDYGLLALTNSCEAYPAAALLAFAQAREFGSSDAQAIGWFLYDHSSAMVIAVLE